MNVLTALVLSIALAEADPATPQRLDSAACIASRLKICETLVDEGYARHGGFSLKGDAIVSIEAAIAVDACPALLQAEESLASAGCQLKREVELTRQAAARSSAQYRQCQRRFPENWDRMCLTPLMIDQQMSTHHKHMLELRDWLGTCAQR